MFLLLVVTVKANTVCFASQSCTLYGSCKNQTYVESTATITIYFPNTTVLVNQESMTEIAIGRFNYTFIAPEIIGNYLETINCSINGFNAVGEDEFTIGENKMIADSIIDVTKLLIVAISFLVHLFILFIGIRFRIMAFSFIGGALGVVAGLVGLALLSPFLNVITTAFFVAYIVVAGMFMLLIMPNKEND